MQPIVKIGATGGSLIPPAAYFSLCSDGRRNAQMFKPTVKIRPAHAELLGSHRTVAATMDYRKADDVVLDVLQPANMPFRGPNRRLVKRTWSRFDTIH